MEKIKQEWPEAKLVGKGMHGSVYRISENIAVKMPYCIRGNSAIDQLNHEFEIAVDLYNSGVSVPRPLYFGDIELRNGQTIQTKGFAMEYIAGTTLRELIEQDSPLVQRAEELREAEI
ncbi:MAG: hypothetical protein KC506_02545, partial [Nanoarchaeota archaeon]|nr:hypothetical protein [Nanoarchaeota archaeon]